MLLSSLAFTSTAGKYVFCPALESTQSFTGVGMLGYTGIGVSDVALASAAVQGAGFAMLFPPMLALIQRVVVEDQRGRVTSVFVALQEAMGLLSSILVGVLAAIIVVRPTLVSGAVLLAALGAAGLRAVVRVRGSGRDRAPAA